MGWLIASAIVGAASSIYSNYQKRQAAKKQAAYQKAQAEAAADTARDNLSSQLIEAKTSDYTSASEITQQAYSGALSANKQLYENQKASEQQYQELVGQGAEASSDLSATSAMSGAEEDTTLRKVMDENIQQKMTNARNQIDTQRDVGAWTNSQQLSAALDKASSLRTKYEEGGSAMRIYNQSLENINNQEDLAVSYYNDVIADNTYNFNWFLTDAFSVADAGFSLYNTGKQQGVW